MSEECKNPGMEMNDAAMENVSGGGYKQIVSRAEDLCRSCSNNPRRQSCPSSNMRLLKAYLKEHGVDSVITYRQCPYFKYAD